MARRANKGEEFESRVARLLVAEGAFVRRRVNLESQFGEKFTITDVDVLAFFPSPSLAIHKVAGECKTTETKNAPSAGDRLLWSTGLGRLVDADSTFIAVMKPARESERSIAALIGSELLDVRDIDRREEILGIGRDSPFGSHDPILNAYREEAKQLAKNDEEVRRFERFVTSELWLSQPVPAFKKALGAARRLSNRWSPKLPDSERKPVEWMLAESIVGCVLALVRLASLGYRQPEEVLARTLYERMAEGLADFEALRAISRQVDKVMADAVSKLDADPSRISEFLGAFEPKPPPYLEPLTEIVERLARKPLDASYLPQLADLRYASWFGVATPEEPANNEGTARLLRLIAAFLEVQIEIPEDVLVPLRTSLERVPQDQKSQDLERSPNSGDQMLLDDA
jgi:hypothetical protein